VRATCNWLAGKRQRELEGQMFAAGSPTVAPIALKELNAVINRVRRDRVPAN